MEYLGRRKITVGAGHKPALAAARAAASSCLAVSIVHEGGDPNHVSPSRGAGATVVRDLTSTHLKEVIEA